MKPKGVTAKQMAEIDKKAQEEYGISQMVLMENAGRSAAETILSDARSVADERIACFCGKGNNGGDGFVAARYLANELPARLTIYAADSENIKKGAAFDNFKIVRELGIEVLPLKDFLLSESKTSAYTISIDAIFGTGFKGELAEEYSSLGMILNSSGNLKRYAVDIPSGLDSTTGIAAKNCLKAHKTITFGLPKQGFFVKDGPGVCGQITVKDIGFPEELLKKYMDYPQNS